jgi:hypothetical protein
MFELSGIQVAARCETNAGCHGASYFLGISGPRMMMKMENLITENSKKKSILA